MKTIIAVSFLLACSAAIAAGLSSFEVKNNKMYCTYSDGTVITQEAQKPCAQWID